MNLGHYILRDDHTAVLCPDPYVWARWMDEHEDDRRVGLTTIGQVDVSTVFLALDHNFFGGEPILFETMVFGAPGEEDNPSERCSTWDQAVAMHARWVRKYDSLKSVG